MSNIVRNLLLGTTNRNQVDPYAANVVLFIKGNGTNGSTSILDTSPSPKTITVNGNTQISTAQSKYNSSIYFDGTGDYLSLADSGDWIINSDFVLECWLYPLVDSPLNYIVAQWVEGGGNNRNFGINTQNWYINRNGTTYSGSFTITLNSWQHLALSINSNIARFFLNGTQQGSSINIGSNSNDSNQLLGIGAYGNGDYATQCYMSHIRVTKGGTARYIANFNPETDTYLNT